MWTAIPKPRIRLQLILAAALTAASLPAAGDVLDSFEAHYRVQRGSIGLGTAIFTLAADGDCYRYHGQAQPTALVSLFVGKITDDSRFCVQDGQVLPHRFEHVEGGDDDDSYTLEFNRDENRVTYKSRAGKTATFKIPKGALEPFVIHMAVRMWLASAEHPKDLPNRTVTLVDEDEVKHYELAIRDGGHVETPAGSWDTVMVARVDDPDRKLRFWLVPELSWLPVKVETKKKDDPVIRMTLRKLPQAPSGPEAGAASDN